MSGGHCDMEHLIFVKGCFQEMSGKMHAIIAEHIVGLPKHWGQMALEDLDHCWGIHLCDRNHLNEPRKVVYKHEHIFGTCLLAHWINGS